VQVDFATIGSIGVTIGRRSQSQRSQIMPPKFKYQNPVGFEMRQKQERERREAQEREAQERQLQERKARHEEHKGSLQTQIDEYLKSEEFQAFGFSDEVLQPKLAEAKELLKMLVGDRFDLEGNPCNDSDDRSDLSKTIAGLREDIGKLGLPAELIRKMEHLATVHHRGW